MVVTCSGVLPSPKMTSGKFFRKDRCRSTLAKPRSAIGAAWKACNTFRALAWPARNSSNSAMASDDVTCRDWHEKGRGSRGKLGGREACEAWRAGGLRGEEGPAPHLGGYGSYCGRVILMTLVVKLLTAVARLSEEALTSMFPARLAVGSMIVSVPEMAKTDCPCRFSTATVPEASTWYVCPLVVNAPSM